MLEAEREITHKMAFLNGDSVVLRPLTLDDLNGSYVSWLNSEEVCRFNSHHRWPVGLENAASFIKSISENRSSLVLAVVLRSSGEHIGNISLQQIDHLSRSAEFAILMGETRHWGKGYAKEAAMLLCNHGFLELNLHRIFCGTHAKNVGMQRLAEYLGMQLEGRSRDAFFKSGNFVDILQYAVLAHEFRGNSK